MSTTHSSGPGITPDHHAADPDSTSEQAKDEGRKVAATAADEATSVAGEAAGKARALVDEAVGQVSDHSRSQLENLVGVLRSVGDDLQDMLSGQQRSGVAGDLVRQVAGRAHAAGDRLDGKEPSEVLDDLRRFAQKRPAVFLGSALVAGVLAGRFARGLKDSQSSGDDDPTVNPTADPTLGRATDDELTAPAHRQAP